MFTVLIISIHRCSLYQVLILKHYAIALDWNIVSHVLLCLLPTALIIACLSLLTRLSACSLYLTLTASVSWLHWDQHLTIVLQRSRLHILRIIILNNDWLWVLVVSNNWKLAVLVTDLVTWLIQTPLMDQPLFYVLRAMLTLACRSFAL